MRVKQRLDAPTSANKLGNEKHLHALRRYILQRWLETGRGKTLIVTQYKAERWLKENGLPPNIHVEHYNAVTGMDIYRDVRLLIIAGRTAPGPDAIETMAGALTGHQPSACRPQPMASAGTNGRNAEFTCATAAGSRPSRFVAVGNLGCAASA